MGFCLERNGSKRGLEMFTSKKSDDIFGLVNVDKNKKSLKKYGRLFRALPKFSSESLFFIQFSFAKNFAKIVNKDMTF